MLYPLHNLNNKNNSHFYRNLRVLLNINRVMIFHPNYQVTNIQIVCNSLCISRWHVCLILTNRNTIWMWVKVVTVSGFLYRGLIKDSPFKGFRERDRIKVGWHNLSDS